MPVIKVLANFRGGESNSFKGIIGEYTITTLAAYTQSTDIYWVRGKSYIENLTGGTGHGRISKNRSRMSLCSCHRIGLQHEVVKNRNKTTTL
jgi:hypothetical protein